MKFLSLMVALGLAMALTACTKQENVDTSGLESRLNQLQTQSQQDQAQMDQMSEQMDQLISEINDLTAENEALATSLAQLAELEEDQSTDLDGLRALIEANNGHIHKYKDKIEKIFLALSHRR